MDIESLSFLVVEDAQAMREATEHQLRALGATDVSTAGSGPEALQVMQKRHVDIVLSGCDMAVMDGLELLGAMRADDRLRHVAMVMVTAEAEHEKIERAIAGGVSGLLVKPYSQRQLESKIAGSLARREPWSAQAALDAAAPAADDKSDSVQQTILVVDDAPDNVQVIAQLFRQRYRVKVAHSGERALDICTSDSPPDLVLLDVMMPGIDGFEVARRMRRHPNSEHIPVIFVTALDDDKARRSGLGLGAVDFVTKPIDPDILRLRVDNFMRYVARHKRRQAECDAMLAAARLREEVEEMLRHDLKNPIAGAIGLARLMAMDTTLTASQSRKLRLIEDAAMQALDTVNMSCEVFKIETGRYLLRPEPVALQDLLVHTVEVVRTVFANKQLEFALKADSANGAPVAMGDAALCSSIFHNLLRNACEAAPAKTLITIEAHDDNPVRIEIANRGAVPLDVRNQFFERRATSGKRGGTGLGTYSAKLLAEAQGGSISMRTNDEDDSTQVEVVLPRYVAEAAA